jgi:hypothetical protein
MPARPDSQSTTRPAPLICAALLCAGQLIVTFPGRLVVDSTQQLSQALSHRYGDWHPPVMAFVWSLLIRITGSSGALLVLHQVLHWLGIGLIADGCYRVNMKKKAWIVLAVGAFPLFWFYDGYLLKDVGMASALVAATGLGFWFFIQDKALPWWVYVASAACLVYGGLIRANAMFALGPIIYIYAIRGRKFNLLKVAGCSLLVVAAAIPLSDWINHRLIGAKSQDPLQSLQIFDLMGIAVHAADSRVWGERPPALDSIESCYSAYWWDTFSPWGICPEFREQMGYVSHSETHALADEFDGVDQNLVSQRSLLWRRAIVAHPLAYAMHRLSHFNSDVYFLVPSLPSRYSKSPEVVLAGRSFTQREIYLDYLKRNFLLWPIFWLAVGACGVVLLKVPNEAPTAVAVAKSLMTSGLFYSGAYLLVGVATDYRYHYWSIMAIMLGVILAAEQITGLFAERAWRGRVAAGVVSAVVIAGIAARMANLRLF